MREKLIYEICKKYEVQEVELYKLRKKKGIIHQARQAGILAASMKLTKNRSILAEWFGYSSNWGVSLALISAQDQYDTDSTFRNQVNDLALKISA